MDTKYFYAIHIDEIHQFTLQFKNRDFLIQWKLYNVTTAKVFIRLLGSD